MFQQLPRAFARKKALRFFEEWQIVLIVKNCWINRASNRILKGGVHKADGDVAAIVEKAVSALGRFGGFLTGANFTRFGSSWMMDFGGRVIGKRGRADALMNISPVR
jgi:hypothetical protein